MKIQIRHPQPNDTKIKTRYCLFPRVYMFDDVTIILWLHRVKETHEYMAYDDGYEQYYKWIRTKVEW